MIFLFCSLLVSFIMLVVFFIQWKTKDASIVDVAWSANLAILVLIYAFFLDGYALRQNVLFALVCIWYIRLSLHLLFDRVMGKEEDGRYQSIRKEYKGNVQFFFLGFFQLQALADALLSISFLIVAINPKPFLDVFDGIAIVLWALSFTGGAISDYQLSKFRSNPLNRGKTCRVGLWQYSRHPNYFFEWLQWLVYPLLAVGSPYWYLTLLAPAMMLYFIVFVTGIPTSETQALRSRGGDYRDYQNTTSPFIPWFPKNR